jgi:hypothetical protein
MVWHTHYSTNVYSEITRALPTCIWPIRVNFVSVHSPSKSATYCNLLVKFVLAVSHILCNIYRSWIRLWSKWPHFSLYSLWFTFNPEQLVKFSKSTNALCSNVLSAIYRQVYRQVSSAYCASLYSMLLIMMPFMAPLWCMACAMTSANKMKMLAEIGHACRIPWLGLNYVLVYAFFKMHDCKLLYMIVIFRI